MRSFEKGRTQPGRQPLLPAATLVLLRDDPEGLRVLLLRRHRRLAFHGGAWVFPGGRIEPADWAAGKPDLLAAACGGARNPGRSRAQPTAGSLCAPVPLDDPPRAAPPLRDLVFCRPGGTRRARSHRRPGDRRQPLADTRGRSGCPPGRSAGAAPADLCDPLGAVRLGRCANRPGPSGGPTAAAFQSAALRGRGPLEGPGPRHRLVMCAEGWCYQPPAPPETQPHPTHNL